MKKCAVIGSINMDLVVGTPRFPAPGETITGSIFRSVPGGKGANQAVALARLGVETRALEGLRTSRDEARLREAEQRVAFVRRAIEEGKK